MTTEIKSDRALEEVSDRGNQNFCLSSRILLTGSSDCQRIKPTRTELTLLSEIECSRCDDFHSFYEGCCEEQN